jgi:hypothetical protein
MAIISIELFVNKSPEPVLIINRDNYNDNLNLEPEEISTKEIWIPWVDNGDQFQKKVLEITFMSSQKKIFIWHSGPRILSSKNGFESPGKPISGYSNADNNGVRKLIIENDTVSLHVL